FRGFLFDPGDRARAQAIIVVDGISDNADAIKATRYSYAQDFSVIRSLHASIAAHLPAPEIKSPAPVLEQGSTEDLIRRLRRHVKAYSQGSTQLQIETVPIQSLVSLSRIVKGFKYRQARFLCQDLTQAHLSLFDPAIVRYADGSETIVTPPVVES